MSEGRLTLPTGSSLFAAAWHKPRTPTSRTLPSGEMIRHIAVESRMHVSLCVEGHEAIQGGGGAVGGMLGAFKKDTLMDLEFGSQFTTKPMKACLPHERLFQGETDGSSFPNGGLRVTHSAAAFTTWDRSSPPFVTDCCLYIPCAFITHFGKCIDEKTPLLRSMDAVKTHGLRLLQAIGIGKDAQTMHSYLGWEQEFFVLSADHFKSAP